MPTSVIYRLCGGTFFTLLSHARLPLLSKAENYAGNKSGRTEPELLWALTRVVRPDMPLKPNIAEKSLKDGTHDFKACISWGHGCFDLGNQSVQRAFDERIRTQYKATLALMAEVVKEFIDVGSSTKKDEYLVKALVEVLNDDDEIEEDKLLYVLEDGRPLTKQEVCTAHEICLQPFLLGLWHYVLTTRGTNTVGKETYDTWCPPKERARREYKKTIGEDSQRDIRIGYCTDFRTDNEVIVENFISQSSYDEKEPLEFFYKSGIYSNQKIRDAIEPITTTENKILDLELNHVYRLTTSFALKSTYQNPLRKRQIEIATEHIKGLTSIENWKSTSYLQNALMANAITCTAIFKVLSKDEQVYVVQFLALQETAVNV